MAFPITLNPAFDGGTIRFRTAEELHGWLNSELTRWEWLYPTANARQQYGRSGELVNAGARQAQAVNAIKDHLSRGNLPEVELQLSSYFGSESSLPTASTAAAALVQHVREVNGPVAALGATAALLSIRFDGDDPLQVRGVVLAHELLQGTGKAARQSVQKALSSLLERLNSQQLRAENRADELDRRVEEIETRRRNQNERLLASRSQARKSFRATLDLEAAGFRDRVQAAIERINQTDLTFKERMNLEAPVTYWRRKAKEHRIKSWVAAAVGLTFAIALVAYAALNGVRHVLELVQSTVKATGKWEVSYVVLTLVLFILTIAFWIGRLISRTYVSQTHLSIDAEERATMVQTYLALAHENQITKEERILVLGALFRPSSDGLVKDDGAPDLGVAGIASRLGVGASGR